MATTQEALVANQIEARVREIEGQLGLDHLIGKLGELPDRIRDQQEAVSAAKDAVEFHKGQVEFEEAVLTATISEAKDERTGKAAFPNDTARRAELRRRMATEEAYQTAAKALGEAESIYRSASFELERLHNEFSATRQAAQLQAVRLRAITGGLTA